MLTICGTLFDLKRTWFPPDEKGIGWCYLQCVDTNLANCVVHAAAPPQRQKYGTFGTISPSKLCADHPGLGGKLLLSFSCHTNAQRLLDTGGRRPDQIPCLDGIRFWSMAWVLVLHTYGYASYTPRLHIINNNDIYTEVEDH